MNTSTMKSAFSSWRKTAETFSELRQKHMQDMVYYVFDEDAPEYTCPYCHDSECDGECPQVSILALVQK